MGLWDCPPSCRSLLGRMRGKGGNPVHSPQGCTQPDLMSLPVPRSTILGTAFKLCLLVRLDPGSSSASRPPCVSPPHPTTCFALLLVVIFPGQPLEAPGQYPTSLPPGRKSRAWRRVGVGSRGLTWVISPP